MPALIGHPPMLVSFTTSAIAQSRSEGAQELLDRRRDEIRLGNEAVAIGGRPREMPQRGADGAPCRVDASKQREPEDAENVALGDRATFEPGGKKIADQVIFGLGLALGDVLLEVCSHLRIGLGLSHGVGDTDFQDLVKPMNEQIVVRRRNADHLGDHPDRNIPRVLLGGVAFSRRDKLIDEWVAGCPRDLGTSRSTTSAVNAGRSSCLKGLWTGGSDVIGGADSASSG